MGNYIGAEKILEKKREYIMPCLGHFYSDPPQFVSSTRPAKNISIVMRASR